MTTATESSRDFIETISRRIEYLFREQGEIYPMYT